MHYNTFHSGKIKTANDVHVLFTVLCLNIRSVVQVDTRYIRFVYIDDVTGNMQHVSLFTFCLWYLVEQLFEMRVFYSSFA